MYLFYTAQLPAGDGPHPVIVLLHGWGASAHDLFGLAPVLHGGRTIVICPQGRVEVPIGPGAPPGWGWFPITMGDPPDRDQVDAALAELVGFLDATLAAYPVDPRRVVLMGFSQGGVMAYQLALQHPERYAGLIAMSSWLPEELAADLPEEQRAALAELPILITHGSSDPMIAIDRAYESRDLLLRLGASPAFREYPMQHEIQPAALRDIVVWLEEKVFSPIQLA